jgi:outer membrane protein
MSNSNNHLSMKKLTLTALIIFISLGAYAQFNQGRMLVGGNFSADFNTNKTKAGSTTTTNYRSTTISFGPQFGYFIIDNLAVGGILTVESESIKYEGSDNKDSGTTTLISPFVRYYLDQGIFFQGKFDVGSLKTKDKTGTTTTTNTYGVSGFSLGAGYAWFLADNVALEPQIGYQSLTYKNKTIDAKSINGGLYILVGFQIYLGK